MNQFIKRATHALTRAVCNPVIISAIAIGSTPHVVRAQIATALPPVDQQRIAGERLTDYLFPIKSQEQAQEFWNRKGSEILTSGNVLFEDKVFGANLELLSDIVGFFRVGIGVTAAASEEDTAQALPDEDQERAAIARLANAGGMARVTIAYPVLFRAKPQFNSTWALMLSFAGGTETPKAGGFLEDPSISGQGGVELFYQRAGLENLISFQFGGTARVYGFNDAYAEKAGVAQNVAFLGVPRIGLVLLQNTRIDLLWRAVRSDAFDDLGKFAVTLQQVTN